MHLTVGEGCNARRCTERDTTWQALSQSQASLSPVQQRHLGKTKSSLSMPIGVLTALPRSRQGSRHGSRGSVNRQRGRIGGADGNEKKQTTLQEGAGWADMKDPGGHLRSGGGVAGNMRQTWGGRKGTIAGGREASTTGVSHAGATGMSVTRRLNSHQGYSQPPQAESMIVP